MTTETDEKVMCVGRLVVNTMLGLPVCNELRLVGLLQHNTYRNRHTPDDDGPDVEHDDRWKQLIPGIVVINSKGQILTYNRGWKGGEDRLKGKWTCLFGGHVNDGDQTWLLGVLREIREELEVGPIGITGAHSGKEGWNPLCGPIGFLNDDSDDVGRHHLGVVYVLRADEVVPRENPEFGWYHPHEFDLAPMLWPERLESWARLALPMVRAWMEAN